MIRRREGVKGQWRGVEERRKSFMINEELLKGNEKVLKDNEEALKGNEEAC